jgi:VanZ family protein
MMARNWWPVVVWLGIIRLESTDFGSAAHTGLWLYRFITFFAPHISFWTIWQLDNVLRKLGHLGGYAILSALVFLALRNTYRDQVRTVIRRTWGTHLRDLWRKEWMLLAMLATIVTASLDEIHQTFIPSRTGRWQDVVIDSSGAVLIQVALYAYSIWQVSRTRERSGQPELAPTR